jgi:hypothetical protein
MSNTDPRPVEQCGMSDMPFNVLVEIVSHLPVQDALCFARVSRSSHGAVQPVMNALGYEPFGERSDTTPRPIQLGMSQPSSPSGLDFKTLQDLACNAWNSMAKAVRAAWLNRKLTEEERAELRRLDKIAKDVTPGYSHNVVSVTQGPDGERLLFAANEQPKGSQLDNIRKVKSSEVVGNYSGAPFQHTETRLAEYQHRQQYDAPIGVDRTCCLFCAAQLVALGRVRNWSYVEAKHLTRYTFSKYVLYFIKYRRGLWGDSMEEVFQTLSPDDRLKLLHLVVAASVPQDLSKEKKCARSLEQLREELGLPAEGKQDANTNSNNDGANVNNNNAAARDDVVTPGYDDFYADLTIEELAAIDAALSSVAPTQTNDVSTFQASTSGPDAYDDGITPEEAAAIVEDMEEIERAKRRRDDDNRDRDAKRRK